MEKEKENTMPDIQLKEPVNWANIVDKPEINTAIICGRSSNAGSAPIGSADTKVPFTNNFANGVSWDDTDDKFTILKAGYYRINANVILSASADATTMILYIYKNGNRLIRKVSMGSAASSIMGIDITSPPELLAVGDTIQIYMSQNSGGDINTYSGAEYCQFGIEKI